MTRYKTPSVKHNPPHKRQSRMYFLAKHLKIFARNDSEEEDGISFADTIPIFLARWTCWLLHGGIDVLTLLADWYTDPKIRKMKYGDLKDEVKLVLQNHGFRS